MNVDVKREIIAKFRDKMEVTQFKPDPPGVKQVDINENKKYDNHKKMQMLASKKKTGVHSMLHDLNDSTQLEDSFAIFDSDDDTKDQLVKPQPRRL